MNSKALKGFQRQCKNSAGNVKSQKPFLDIMLEMINKYKHLIFSLLGSFARPVDTGFGKDIIIENHVNQHHIQSAEKNVLA